MPACISATSGACGELGINTIEGWFEPQFDQVTLEYAARNNIGVLMPFELNQDWPYENPNVRQSILDHVSAYVARYKNSPAVRMWAPGNENLHRILYPHMKTQADDPAVRARAVAFAEFLPVLVDRIHAIDPDHPVIYRDAEDVYLPLLKQAFQANGIQPTVACLWRQRLFSGPPAADRGRLAIAVAGRTAGDFGICPRWCWASRAADRFRAGLDSYSFAAWTSCWEGSRIRGQRMGQKNLTGFLDWWMPRRCQLTDRWRRSPPATSPTTTRPPRAHRLAE